MILITLLAAPVAHACCAPEHGQRDVQLVDALRGARLNSSAVVVAQAPAGEVERQVPVVEGVERPDNPVADEERGNDEADLPSARPPSDVVAPPPADVPQGVVQPPVQQD